MHELMFKAGVKGMSERSELIPCNIYYFIILHLLETSAHSFDNCTAQIYNTLGS